MLCLPSETSPMQRPRRPSMGSWPSQQKDQAVPQLSCAMCRDRKLKCDKLDPCSNCTSSGVVCMPIYRPRLPRGRHARPAQPKTTSSSSAGPMPPATRRHVDSISSRSPAAPVAVEEDRDLGARIDRLESLVQRGEAAKIGIEAETNGLQELLELVRSDRPLTPTTTTQLLNLRHRIRGLESLVQEVAESSNTKSKNDNNNNNRASPEPSGSPGGTAREQLGNSIIVRTTKPAPPTSSSAKQSPELFSDIWADLMDHEMHDQPAHGDSAETVSIAGIGALRLLGIDSSLCLSSISLPRDKGAASKLCQVYLQNVDPIIKILHRPSLSKWMLDGGPYMGSAEGDCSVRALESAVCYAAVITMTETQCQAVFQKSKSVIVAMHRKMCEDAFDKAGLLTTRDMIVLQAFILYLSGRRSEEKGTAVWALVALAVRLTSAMGLNQEPGEVTRAGESFFQQQMRLRLWLTVCLLDLQASFAQASEPLISHRDAASAVPHVAHVNDSDFDVDTAQPVASHEELTDTTFALVTYYVQVAGRLLNFASPESSNTTSGSSSNTVSDDSSAPAALFSQAERQKLVGEFQQQVFTLLHYCDPESSAYAWFTWHSTQSIVAAVRLSELLPFRCGRTGSRTPLPSPQAEGDTTLLRRALHNLEKAQLICSDPRGDGFRWYITMPWLALSTAVVECNTCTDMALVRRAWPVIETSYREHEVAATLHDCPLSQPPLAQLMSETREKLAPLLNGLTHSATPRQPGGTPTPIDPSLTTSGSLTTDSTKESEASGQSFGQQIWNLTSISMDEAPVLDGVLRTPELYNPLQSDFFEQSWITADTMSPYSHLAEVSDKRQDQGILFMSTNRGQ